MNQGERDRYHFDVLSAVAHEMRNPLQGIMASAAVMGCQVANHPALEPFLQTIIREASRINEIIAGMLELIQPLNFDRKPHSLRTILEHAIRNTHETAYSRQATIHFEPKTNIPRVRADGNRLTQAFSAILLNAIESKEHGVRIEIHIERQDSKIFVRILDNGDGISMKYKRRVFEPFFSTNNKKGGLGLSVADFVVRSHDGQIQIQSELGKGTEVEVLLPLLK